MLEVAGEGVRVLEADGDESAGFKGLAREVKERRGGSGCGDQGVEVEEGEFGFGEEGGGFGGCWGSGG